MMTRFAPARRVPAARGEDGAAELREGFLSAEEHDDAVADMEATLGTDTSAPATPAARAESRSGGGGGGITSPRSAASSVAGRLADKMSGAFAAIRRRASSAPSSADYAAASEAPRAARPTQPQQQQQQHAAPSPQEVVGTVDATTVANAFAAAELLGSLLPAQGAQADESVADVLTEVAQQCAREQQGIATALMAGAVPDDDVAQLLAVNDALTAALERYHALYDVAPQEQQAQPAVAEPPRGVDPVADLLDEALPPAAADDEAAVDADLSAALAESERMANTTQDAAAREEAELKAALEASIQSEVERAAAAPLIEL